MNFFSSNPSFNREKTELSTPSASQMLHVRRLYELPQSFLLVAGDMDTRHGHATLITTVVERGIPIDLVMISRHTHHADEILSYARRQKIATRVHMLYEVDSSEISALYALSLGLIYMPPEGASVEPIKEGLRQGSTMILSSTRINRDVAFGSAIFLNSINSDELSKALRSTLFGVSYSEQMDIQSLVESEGLKG